MSEHWFWFALTIAVMVWYSTTTLYVGVRGTLDIKHMLRRLKAQQEPEPSGENDRHKS